MARLDNPLDSGNKTTYDWFVNPVGAVADGFLNDYAPTQTNSDGSTSVIGNMGSVRHTGNFQEGNPYLTQLRSASKNQDKDALYELAVQWEADYANRQLQLQENKAILDEQREYDSAVNQIARQRAAGINADVEGGGISSSSGGSAGGSAQLVNPGMADQTGQTKFSNAYDNAQLVMEGINTAANVVSSFTGFAGVGLDFAKTIATWGDMLSQSKSQTSILESGAKSAQANAVSAGLDNALTMLNTAGQVSQMFGEDTPSADIVKMLGGIGFTGAEQLGPVIDTYRSSPALKAYHQKQDLARKHAAAENEAAAYDNLLQTYSNHYEAGMYESTSRRTVSQFQQWVDSMAYTQSNAQAAATTLENQIQSGATSSELVRKTVEHNLNQFISQLQAWERTVSDSAGRVEKFAKLYKENSNAHYKALWDAAKMNHLRICTTTAENMSSIFDIMDNYSSMDYIQDTMFNADGEPTKLSSFVKGRFIDYNNFVFDKNYDPANGKLDLNAIIGTATALFLGGKALKAGKAVTTTNRVTPLVYGSDGSPISTVTTKTTF